MKMSTQKCNKVSGKHEISGILEGRAQVRSGLTFWTWGYLGAGPRRVLKGQDRSDIGFFVFFAHVTLNVLLVKASNRKTYS